MESELLCIYSRFVSLENWKCRYIAVTNDSHVQVWNTPNHLVREFAPFHLHRTYTGHHDEVLSIEWSPDSKWGSPGLLVDSNSHCADVSSRRPVIWQPVCSPWTHLRVSAQKRLPATAMQSLELISLPTVKPFVSILEFYSSLVSDRCPDLHGEQRWSGVHLARKTFGWLGRRWWNSHRVNIKRYRYYDRQHTLGRL